MVFIGRYNELIPGKGYPSMKDFFSRTPYEGQQKIIDYLLHGIEDIVSGAIPKDVISGRPIRMEKVGMNDGEYTWFNTLAYYVQRYNLRLPKEFEEKVLSEMK